MEKWDRQRAYYMSFFFFISPTVSKPAWFSWLNTVVSDRVNWGTAWGVFLDSDSLNAELGSGKAPLRLHVWAYCYGHAVQFGHKVSQKRNDFRIALLSQTLWTIFPISKLIYSVWKHHPVQNHTEELVPSLGLAALKDVLYSRRVLLTEQTETPMASQTGDIWAPLWQCCKVLNTQWHMTAHTRIVNGKMEHEGNIFSLECRALHLKTSWLQCAEIFKRGILGLTMEWPLTYNNVWVEWIKPGVIKSSGYSYEGEEEELWDDNKMRMVLVDVEMYRCRIQWFRKLNQCIRTPVLPGCCIVPFSLQLKWPKISLLLSTYSHEQPETNTYIHRT